MIMSVHAVNMSIWLSLSHYTIAHQLGLNTELTKAIAVGHDLGHAPFGHGGETILTDIAKSHDLDKFWHEKNSLHFVDHIELLEDNNHYQHNLKSYICCT